MKLADSPDELREITREMPGKRLIDHNLDEIADGFIAFVREQWLEFWGQ